MLVKSERQIDNVELELLVGSDNDRDDGIEIKYSDSGLAEKNGIKNVDLAAGKNKIKIQFADNLKHAIKIKAYEIQ